jgi:hypothetical protein
MDNIDKPRNRSLPYLELSGIIDLRRHCIGIVSAGQKRAARRYMTEDVPALLHSLELWVEAGARGANAQQKVEIREAIERLESGLERVSNYWRQELRVS